MERDKEQALQEEMERLGIREEELVEKFILGSGRGGQNLQKTSSCVYLKHLPTGIEVKCQGTRSRDLNRFLARRELCRKLEEVLFQKKSAKQQAIEKIRRQKRKRSKRSKEKMLEGKRRRSEVKAKRRVEGD